MSFLWEERGKVRVYSDPLPLIWDLWAAIFFAFGAIGARPFLVRDFLSSLGNFPIGKNFGFLWRTVSLCLLWATWKERNRVVFEDSLFSTFWTATLASLFYIRILIELIEAVFQ